MGVYSFNGNKIITTSGGGALVTNDPAIAARVRKLATQGRDQAEHYQHSEVAYNYRMSNVLAGIGLGQIEVLEERVARRRQIFARYRSELASFPGLSFQEEVPGSYGNRWLTVANFDPNHLSIHPYQLMRRLRERGIETRPAWKPMHMQPLCAGCDFEPHSDLEVVSSAHFLRSLCLPSGSSLTDAEQGQVIASIHEICTGSPH
jgi:pyridoxal phosphate-dependent aminotransferase EpsN